MLDGDIFEEELKKENQGELKNLLRDLPSLRQAGFFNDLQVKLKPRVLISPQHFVL